MQKLDSLLCNRKKSGRRFSLLSALLLSAAGAGAQTLSGTYYVGSSTSPNPARTYADLPAAMTALGNGVTANSSVTFTLLDAAYPLGATSLVVPAVALSTGQGVSLVPAAGVSPVISGSNTTALIDLNGTDYFTISGYDGSTSARTLTLRNTAAGPAVLLRNDATYNTLRNLVIESANTSTSSGTVLFSTSTGTTGNDFNTLASCDVRPANNSTTVLPANGIYSVGTAGATNSDNTVRGCTIYNFTATGLNVNTNSGDNWTVGGATAAEGNTVYETVSRSVDLRFLRLGSGSTHTVSNNQLYYASGTLSAAFYGVVLVGGTGHTVSNNAIGGSQAGAGGTAFTIGAVAGFVYPIYLDLSTTAGAAATTVQGNVIRNFASASTGTMYGVHARNGTANIVTLQANTIGGTGAGQGITHAGTFYGFDLGNAVGATVQNNTVAGITTTVTNATGLSGTLAGVNMSSSSASTISGNTFSNFNGTTTNTVTSNTVNTANATPVAGVYVSGSGAATISGNTMSTLASGSTYATGGTGVNIALAGVWLNGGGAVAVANNTISGLTAATGGAAVFGIYSSGSGSGTISGNQISGLSSSLTAAAQLAGINSTGSGVVTISTNTLSSLSQSGASGNLYGIQNTAATGSDVTGNTITNVTYAGTSTGQTVYGISANGSNSISNNTITTVQATGPANANVRGMYVGGTSAVAIVSGNAVSTVLNGTSGASTNTAGIYVGATSGAMGAVTISGNRISNVGTTATAAPTGGTVYTVTGLQCGASAAGSVIERNRVWNVYGSSAGTGANADQVRGLAVIGTYSGTFANNQISLAAGAATQLSFGIQDLSTTGSNSYYYNSVYLAPASAAAASSYGFWRSATTTPATVQLRNNLLYNGRTAASGATAYAVGTASTTGWSATTSDYNLLISPSATAVGNWGGTALSFAGWKAAQPAGSGGDASSLSTTSAAVPAANLFTDLATGNLDINPANPEAWYANGTGVQVAGQTADFGSGTAGRATTVAAGGTDIGSDDFTPTSTPPALTASAAPALGGTQVFSLGGRVLASLTYGSTGTVPSLVTARYYSGTNPPAPYVASARFANAYFTFTDVNGDGTGYTYQPTLSYDPALLGTIASEAAQRISQRTASNSGYATFATATVDQAARTVTTSAQLTRLGLLTTSDQAAPLPVTLTSFTAFRREANAELNWVTATEKNSAGYEVQVSGDGREFRKLAFVKSGLANSSAPQFYQYLDTEAGKAGLRYYRLRQLDLDGTESFSPVQVVSFGEAAPTAALAAYPSPFATTLTVAVNGPALNDLAPLTITDAMGRVVYSEAVKLAAGTTRLELTQLGALPAGVYLLHVALPSQVQHLKIVKQ
ncbi:T9SS type A sorting domain-containing protein [Microvirga sp. STS02]|uniref:T9SS type A sorting domain-containing protein n=1 Tax=Hymenobacter negativus TaxID=2795026 RepID=UPI0018DD6B8F|nr:MULTISPECIES: T9SS type A sorting domain-containing protein [Bacteria]MBH8567332.1 T9SS type A sorting domain-containing protein [Hymenobacter negativus]MBR7207064.1 T9SS type A sorting domain-containing protein [Microvirga sp. STS02]